MVPPTYTVAGGAAGSDGCDGCDGWVGGGAGSFLHPVTRDRDASIIIINVIETINLNVFVISPPFWLTAILFLRISL
jgi:hypothetical protein